MSGISSAIAFGVTRVVTTFAHEDGTEIKNQGTGFWVRGSKDEIALVTNRHNVDSALKYDTSVALKKIEIELRENPTKLSEDFTSNTVFFEIANPERFIFPDDGSDVAVHPAIKVKKGLDLFISSPVVHIKDLAEVSEFDSTINMMDIVSFVGFPRDWYDLGANLPIARIASISSIPSKPFKNKYISGNLVLVAGLSFEGSSGSPVISHEKGINPSTGIVVNSFRPARVVGIMAGHLKNERYEHAGLSYFYKSTSILSALKLAGIEKAADPVLPTPQPT